MLEGSERTLGDIMAAIGSDPRHEAVRRLLGGEIARRRFPGWSMAFIEAPGADDLLAQLLTAPEVSPERSERVLALLFEAASH